MTLDGRIRLVVTDIDGTLLDSAGRVSEEALAILKRVASGGATVSLATSRRWVGANAVAEELGLDCPLILYDGAITRQYSSGEILASYPLQREVARVAVAALVSHGLRPIAQYNGPGGESMLTIPADPETDYAARFVERFQGQIQIAPLDELTQGQDTLLRVVAFAPHDILLDTASSFTDAWLGTQLLEMGGYETAELTFFAPGASKGSALLALAERSGDTCRRDVRYWRWTQRHFHVKGGRRERRYGRSASKCPRGGAIRHILQRRGRLRPRPGDVCLAPHSTMSEGEVFFNRPVSNVG